MTEESQWELVSWEGFYTMARDLAFKIVEDNYMPDIIIAIARGGYIPARILSDYLGVMDMTSFKVKHYQATQKQPEARIEHPLAADVSGQKVLLVDDVSDTGDTFEVAIEHIRQSARPAEIRTAVLHHKIVSRYKPDYFNKEVKEWHWITYPWAVIEDLTGYIGKMDKEPDSIETIYSDLNENHNLQVDRDILENALRVYKINKTTLLTNDD